MSQEEKKLIPASLEAIESTPGPGDFRIGEVISMLVTLCLFRKEAEINVHVGTQCWIDIDQVHIELSLHQMEKLLETINKAKLNEGRTVTAQW